MDDWKEVVRAARDQRKVSDLARLADQAFGKSQPEEEHGGEEDEVRRMSRAERSALIARLQEEERTQRVATGNESDPREQM